MRGFEDECVDLIYLDPPFNSNRNYKAPIGSQAAGAAFKDTWTLSDVDNAWHGEIAEKEPAVYEAISTSELTHSKAMKSYLIMMAVRLLEMKRILKLTGSIYLHCDPTASHYLKMLMDSIFGGKNFRNDIVWQRYGSHNDALRRYSRVHDNILFYSVSKNYLWTGEAREKYDKDYIERSYRNSDAQGRFTTAPLHARTLSGGGYEYEWKSINDVWRFPKERLDELNNAGLIYWPPKGKIPRRKVYLDELKGLPARDVIVDIPLPSKKERTGYPTQKPLALLERIIKASSNEGDIILDPFCGCATALVAAEKLGRRWVGIDISPKAVDLVKIRMKRETDLFDKFNPIHRTDIPKRGGSVKNYRDPDNKKILYGQQEGKCNGCKVLFPYRNMTVDHLIAQNRGGSDDPENLQLLCGACNSMKGDGTQEQLIVRLKEAKVLYR